MEIKKILKIKMIKKLPFNNNNLINKKFQKTLKNCRKFHNIYLFTPIQNKKQKYKNILLIK